MSQNDCAVKPQPGYIGKITYPEHWNLRPRETEVGANGIYMSQAYVESGLATVEIVQRATAGGVGR